MENKRNLISWLCAALMLVMLVLQFLPFWSFTGEAGETSCSVNSFVWMPREHPDVTTYLQSTLGEEWTVQKVYAMPALQLVAGALGVAFALIKPAWPLGGICAVFCGGFGLWGYLTNAALKLGGMWGLHLAVSALVFAAGLFCLVSFFWKKD